MRSPAAALLALLPALALADHWNREFVDHGFVQVPFEIVEDIKENVEYAKDRVQDRVFGCQPTSTVVHGTTVVHQTVTSPPPYAAPTEYPAAQVVGVSTVNQWGTLVTWEQKGTTTLPVPCHTAAGHHHGYHKKPEWAVFSKRLPDGDVTIRHAFVPTTTHTYEPTPTHSYVPACCSAVEKPSVVTVTRVVDHHDVVTRVVDRYHTATVTVQENIIAEPYTTTVTVAARPSATPYQRFTLAPESRTVEGWKYLAVSDNFVEIYVNHHFQTTLTIAGVFVPTTRFHVNIDGKDLGRTSEPRWRDTAACCDRDSGDKCIAGGASWGQWVLPAGHHKVVVTAEGPERGYLTYKVAAFN